MTRRELIAWCLLAFVLGILLGLALSHRGDPPPPRKSKAARPPMARPSNKIIDIYEQAG